MNCKITSNIALFIVLFCITLLVIFPILGNMPQSELETSLLATIQGMRDHDLASVLCMDSELFVNIYAYIVNLIVNIFPDADKLILLRLPGAAIMTILTLCLFNFEGTIDKLNISFLAALLFLSCGLSVKCTFQAAPILFPASLFIFALMSLYHWLHHQSQRYFSLLVFSTALATFFIGTVVPVSLLIIACVFIGAAEKGYTIKSYFSVITALGLATALSFVFLYLLLGDIEVCERIFNIQTQLISTIDANFAYIFMNYLLFAIFPWSIPLLLSTYWLARNPHWVWSHFLNLSLLQRFGVVLFLFSLPSLFFATPLSFILIIASMFFNMPLIGKYLLAQFNGHSTVWRITGTICATFAGIGTVLFILLKSGIQLHFGVIMNLPGGWTFWSVSVSVFIFMNIYLLWRNKRNISTNHRYLYILSMLYIAAIILYTGYINGQLTVS